MRTMPGEQIEDPCQRLEAALTEAGFPGLRAQYEDHAIGAVVSIRGFAPGYKRPGPAVVWMAFHVCKIELPCWACFIDSRTSPTHGVIGRRCIDGECSHPEGPARPPRELLCA